MKGFLKSVFDNKDKHHQYGAVFRWSTFLLSILFVFLSVTNFLSQRGVIYAETTSTSTSTPVITDATSTAVTDTSTTTATTTDVVLTSTPEIVATSTEVTSTSTPTVTEATSTEPIVYIDNSQAFITKIYSPILFGTFHSGVIPVIVIFNKNVNVSGDPKLVLITGPNQTTLIDLKYATGKKLYFLYHISSGDSVSLLSCNSSSAIDLNGGSIKDGFGNDAVISLPEPGSIGSLSGRSKITIDAL